MDIPYFSRLNSATEFLQCMCTQLFYLFKTKTNASQYHSIFNKKIKHLATASTYQVLEAVLSVSQVCVSLLKPSTLYSFQACVSGSPQNFCKAARALMYQAITERTVRLANL